MKDYFKCVLKRKTVIFMSAVVVAVVLGRDGVASQTLPEAEQTHTRILPNDVTIKTESAYKKLYEEQKGRELSAEDVERRLKDIRTGMQQNMHSSSNLMPPISGDSSQSSRSTQRYSIQYRTSRAPTPNQPTILSFAVTEKLSAKKTVLPAGGTAPLVVLTGVEAGATEPYPMLLAVNGPFLLPNKRKANLTDCYVLAMVKANLSSERVLGETTEINCLRENGEHIKRPFKGYLSGSDSSFGIQGALLSNQRQVFMTSVLASLAKGAGEAVAMAQKTTTVVQNAGGTQSATNLSGNQFALAAGQATTDAAAQIAEWYLSYAKQLTPSIAVGSGGQGVWVTLLDTVEIPPLTLEDEDSENE